MIESYGGSRGEANNRALMLVGVRAGVKRGLMFCLARKSRYL